MTTVSLDVTAKHAARPLFDLAASPPIQGENATTSRVASAPRVLQLSGVTATCKVQGRVHASANWVDIQTLPETPDDVLVVLAAQYNFVRVVGLTAPVKVYAQD